jgi:peptidyl-prolyl cis-trans isomerase SurA
MRSIIAIAILSILTPKLTNAQTLFSYGGHEVSVQEFKRVYEKNNIQKKVDYSASAINDYLKLYSLFKMKVKEAEALHLDTVVAISRELDNYRKQLAKNYLTDAEVTNRLVVETYNRMKEEIKVAHILVSVLNSASPEDTLKAYRKADSIYNALMGKKKADFAATAKVLSDDKGSATSGGEIGYITALQTIYSFENVAYATPLGAISKPFRSIFGYHIVKVLDRRPTQGEVQVAQILLATPKSKGEDGVREANVKADSIVNAIKAGADFAAMVQTLA